MLINYDMLDHLLDDYFDDRQTEDYDIDHNRLRHNLVEIFGFNEIPKENIRQHKSDGNYPEFFEQLESYGENGGLLFCLSFCSGGTNIYHWVEYHHPDFLKRDSSNVDNPKGKNSKFFKLCQTLKMPYRLRKKETVSDRSSKRRRSNGFRVSFRVSFKGFTQYLRTCTMTTFQHLMYHHHHLAVYQSGFPVNTPVRCPFRI